MSAGRDLGRELAHPWGEHGTALGGLTKREAFAMAAMQGILACPADDLGQDIGSETEVQPEDMASYAVECADALLAELAKDGDA